VKSLDLYLDDGSGEFESGADLLLVNISALNLVDGSQLILLPPGISAEVQHGTPKDFFAVVEFAVGAATATPNTLVVTHTALAGAAEEPFGIGIPLLQEFSPDVSTSVMTVGIDGDADGVSNLLDCDDADAVTFPGAPQICDGVNNDCEDPTWPAPPAAESDDDGDGYVECSGWSGLLPAVLGGDDCDDLDPATFPSAPEVNDAADNQCPGDQGFGVVDEISGPSGFHDPGDAERFSWDSQVGATLYRVVRSPSPTFAFDCSIVDVSVAFWQDTALPSPGGFLHYLVRPLVPSPGSWGQDSSGIERFPACP
jgi:hypothetical protein